jgi:hypothetical protein
MGAKRKQLADSGMAGLGNSGDETVIRSHTELLRYDLTTNQLYGLRDPDRLATGATIKAQHPTPIRRDAKHSQI